MKDIVALAKKKGLSINDICTISGKSRATIWRWENPGIKNKNFLFDDGISRLIKAVADDPI